MEILKDMIGFILPPLIDVINTRIINANVRFVVSMVISVAVAVVVNLEQLQTGSWEELLGKAGIVFAEAQIIYKLYWEKSETRQKFITK